VNREELDAWFAEADDVLADWWGSPDAAEWPPRDTDPVLHPAVAYSYEPLPLIGLADLVRQVREAAERFAAYAPRMETRP
jgi:hypothetical protein